MLIADALPRDAYKQEDLMGVIDLHFHQRHPERILFQGAAFFYWVTEDYGKTYKAFPTPGREVLAFGWSSRFIPMCLTGCWPK